MLHHNHCLRRIATNGQYRCLYGVYRDRGARSKVGGLTIECQFTGQTQTHHFHCKQLLSFLQSLQTLKKSQKTLIKDQHTRSVQIQCKKRRDYNFSIENTTLK